MTNVIEINKDDYSDNEYRVKNEITHVEYIDSYLPYEEYFRLFLRKNVPCVIKHATDSWPCRRKWQTNDAPNFEYLKSLFGSSVVPVADCTTKYYNSQMKTEMTLNDYIDYWVTCRMVERSKNTPLLYLKDWHCVNNHPELLIYETPRFFASDWLNEYYTEHKAELKDDYMFVYMGPKGTWTPFHADVFSSYSWSANIAGEKHWLFFPPGEENRLRDKYGRLVYDVTSDDLSNKVLYPNYNDKSTLKVHEIIQRAGEIVFVPSGWHHQVRNMEDTISINHNWINGCNIMNVWISLKKELRAVMKEVEDCRDMQNWEDHCQLMLKASHGMNYVQFYDFLSFIANKRISFIKDNTPVITFDKWYLGRNHCLYDLKQIRIVLGHMIRDCQDKCIESLIFTNNQAGLIINRINEILPANISSDNLYL